MCETPISGKLSPLKMGGGNLKLPFNLYSMIKKRILVGSYVEVITNIANADAFSNKSI